MCILDFFFYIIGINIYIRNGLIIFFFKDLVYIVNSYNIVIVIIIYYEWQKYSGEMIKGVKMFYVYIKVYILIFLF